MKFLAVQMYTSSVYVEYIQSKTRFKKKLGKTRKPY